jgi:hypothetical protein
MPLRLSILAAMNPQDRLRMPSFQNARAKCVRQPAWGLGHEVAPPPDMHFIDTPILPQTTPRTTRYVGPCWGVRDVHMIQEATAGPSIHHRL